MIRDGLTLKPQCENVHRNKHFCHPQKPVVKRAGHALRKPIGNIKNTEWFSHINCTKVTLEVADQLNTHAVKNLS